MKTLALAMITTAVAASAGSAASVAEFDTNGDHFASFGEVVAVNPKISHSDFRDIDINRDNRLGASEVQAGEAILGRGFDATGTFRSTIDISGGSFVTYGALQEAYPGLPTSQARVIDGNKDGRIGSTELAAGQSALGVYDSGGQARTSYKAIDTDSSRFASLSELQVFFPNLSENDLRVFDVNRDGRIAFNEFYSPLAVETLGKNK